MILALSTNEYQIFYQTHTVAGKDLIDASRGVLSGHPPWRAFQAQLLGPLAFAGFEAVIEWDGQCRRLRTRLSNGYFRCPRTRDLAVLNAFVALMILAKNFVWASTLLLRLSRKLDQGGRRHSSGATRLVRSVLLSNYYWLYMWDSVLSSSCSVFWHHLIFCRDTTRTWLLWQLDAVSLANRESAGVLRGLVAVPRDSPGADTAPLRVARSRHIANTPGCHSRRVCNNVTTTRSHPRAPWVTRQAAFGRLRPSARAGNCIRH